MCERYQMGCLDMYSMRIKVLRSFSLDETFFWYLCLYIGVILVFVLQAQPTTGTGGPIKVEFQYQQF
jgi:hypothetical protein